MQSVKIEMVEAHVALVSICRPEARNAVDGNVAAGLAAAIRATNDDAAVRVVILTGSGSAFCAGGDLNCAARGEQHLVVTAEGGFAGFVTAERSKPWIAAVNGPALAGGFELVLACDLVVASERATFGLPEVKRGLVAAGGGVARLPRSLPRAIAIELIATGRAIAADAAFRWGLANRLVAHDSLLDAAFELAAEVSENAPFAVRESLNIARRAHDLSDAELMRQSDVARAAVGESADYREGVAAFLEKRAPRWTGH